MGGRGSGSGRAGGGSGGVAKSPAAINREIEKTGFKDAGGGVYTFDTPYGGGQIERADMPFVGPTYQAHAWNADYDIFRDERTGAAGTRRFSSLNVAKSWIKNAVKEAAKQ